MALKILIADPDQKWLESVKATLKTALYDVDVVENGRDAQLFLYNNKYFAVILNWDLKNHSGPQVLKFIKTNYAQQRVLLILENDSLITDGGYDSDKFQKLGVTEYAVRPFGNEKMIELLEGHQSLSDMLGNLPKRDTVSAEQEVAQNDEDFTSVRIDEFYSAQAVLFDIFIKLSSNRYIKILHAGDKFTKDRIDKYRDEKGVTHLYFMNRDRRKYLQFTNNLTQKLVSSQNISAEKKIGLLKNVTAKYMEEVFTSGMKPQVIDQGKEICSTVYNMIEKQQDLYKVLRTYQDFDPNAFDHAFLVTLFSTAIIKQFEWQSKATIESAAMACMFHDIGKMKLPKEFLTLKKDEMNESQFEEYKKHCEYGMHIVEGNRLINNSVKQIIYQHHEYFDGTGFPNNLKGSKILTLANILCLADDFAHYLVDEKLKPMEALKKMISNPELVKHYNTMIFENFIKVFVDPNLHKKKQDTEFKQGTHLVQTKKAS